MKNLYFLLIAALFLFSNTNAQNFRRTPTPNDTLTSPKVLADGRVLFSIYAPNAESVRLGGSDIPGTGMGTEMTKREDGVWQVTLGPIDAGAYRYNFNVDGISVIDPRSPSVSESNMNVWSLVYVPGSDIFDIKNVPHGAVAEITYYSSSLERFRRMHVYTPPGYETSTEKYPVFYLLHGAFDCDDSWTSVGRAGYILDNLIATGGAQPMVVIMPAGHTGPFRFGAARVESAVDAFLQDFLNDIVPHAESHYRVYADINHRAIAGLSMGGAQVLNLAEKFAYFGVFSSGIFGIVNPDAQQSDRPTWEEQHKDFLENDEIKKNLKLAWFATGKDDFLVETSRATVELLRKYNFDVIYKESDGGHTWINWRNYLAEFVPLLFQD
ncbi:esterase [candidate division KSB1 bacterium]|nr:esterase [candidate division KSB1 bacterium]RQW05539.1 MAG: esterase [candidate division KSB1 bacterium]